MNGEDADRPLRLLSLDGGGIRGLSSLIILKHLMKKLNPKNPPKPCEYFDLIGGTSTGGLIAIMLGRLHMDVPECIDKYLQLSELAFTPKRSKMNIINKGKDLWTLSGKYRSDSLVKAFKTASNDAVGDADTLLYEQNGQCKVFVCTQSKTLNTPLLLRSYTTADSVDGLSTGEVKIWEAARATSAASTFFDPIRIGAQEFVDGATGRNNPVESVLTEARSLWRNATSRIQCLVSIGTGKSQLRDFGNNLVEVKRTLVALATETEDTERRVYQNQENLGVGGRYFRFNVDRGMEGVVLDEYEKQGTIVAATEAYLEDPRVKAVVARFFQAKAPQYALVTETDREKYLNWLPYVDPRGSHNTARDRRTDKSTGEWFLQGQFQTWTKEPRSFMWLHARAGSGKTVLSSTIIDTIEWNHRGTLAFFYFSIQNEPVTLHKFKCSLVVQILKCLIRPSKIVPSFYEAPIAFVKLYREYVPSPEPRVEDLDRVILDLLELSGDAYIIVDALDECVPQGLRSRVIKFLGWLSCADRGNTRILVTSRREPDIEEAIKALTMTKHTVPLHVEEINRDIKKHLENHLQMDIFKRWSGSLKSEVMDYLTKHAEGVFRWVDLQIQALSTQEREKDVRRALKKLPKDLEATYEAILHRIQAEDKAEEALAILRWLAYSTRFLTLAEAAEIAAFEIDDSDVLPEADEFSVAFYPGNRFLEASSIQRILAGLVTVDETGTTSGDVVIYFAHSSVQDYLHSHAVAPPSFRLDSINSHWFIFKSCNAYIAHYDEADQGGEKEPPYPLMGYACQRVDQHLWELLPYDVRRHCGYQRPPPITTAGEQGKASTLYRRFAAREQTTLGAASLVTRPFVPLGFSFDRFHDALVGAASAGEPELVRLVLDSGTVQPEMGGNTALHAAALKFNVWLPTKTGIPDDVVDYPAVVRELIRAGHSINPAGPGGQTPLHVASAFGYSDIVGCLLEFCDVDVLAADYKGFTPLIMAAESGYGEVVRLLLNHPDVRVDDTDEEGRTALSWAAAGGYDEIVDLLLEYGKANPNAVDCRGRTALIWASSLGRDMVVMRLLSLAAIQPDKRCVLGRTAVSWAALRGHQDIVMRLLNRGDVTANPIDNDGRDIHTLARSRGHAALSPEDAADTKVDNDTIALVDSDSSRSLTLSSSTTATFNTRVSIDKLPSKLKSEAANRDILDFQASELGNHQREVWYVQFSNDGRQLVTCGGFHRVIIWDLATRAALFALKGHKDFVTRAAWSPDDSMLVTVSVDSHARLWDADNGNLLRVFGPYSEPRLTCVWAPDQKSFFIGVPDEKSTLIQETVFKGGGGSVWADGFKCLVSAVCGQGRWLLASDSYKSIHVYDVATKRLLHTIPLPLRCSDLCGSLAYPRALVRYVDGGMSLIDVLSGKIVQQFSDPGDGCSAYTLSCSLGGPNESLVLHCGEDGSISVFNKETGELITRLKAHDQPCNSVQWSPVDPHLFASASDDGRVLLWTSQNHFLAEKVPPLETRVRLLENLDVSTECADFLPKR